MKYKVRFTNQFKKDIRPAKKQGKNIDRLFGVLETLIERSNLFSYKDKHFYLFAKAGFTKGCTDKAAELGNVTLVTYDQMLNA